MQSTCMKCGRTFVGMTAFDAHWRRVPMKAGAMCRDPEEVGLVRKRNGIWGQPAGDYDRKLEAEYKHAVEMLRDGLTP